MKLLTIALLISVQCFSQTGKMKSNSYVFIELSEGNVQVRNINPCRSTIQVAFMGDTVTVQLELGEYYKFTTKEKTYEVSARNATLCNRADDDRWITIKSDIQATKIKVKDDRSFVKWEKCNNVKY